MTSFTRKCRKCKGTGAHPDVERLGAGPNCDACNGSGMVTRPVRVRTDLDPRLGRKTAGAVSVTLYPGGDIGFRKLKTRREVRLPLSTVYAAALKAEAAVKLRERKARRKR